MILVPMSILHLCNTFFEWELAGEAPSALERAFEKSEIFLQLQFLPLLYAQNDDGLLTTFTPEEKLALSPHLLNEHPPFKRLETWGYSLLAQKWALAKKIL